MARDIFYVSAKLRGSSLIILFVLTICLFEFGVVSETAPRYDQELNRLINKISKARDDLRWHYSDLNSNLTITSNLSKHKESFVQDIFDYFQARLFEIQYKVVARRKEECYEKANETLAKQLEVVNVTKCDGIYRSWVNQRSRSINVTVSHGNRILERYQYNKSQCNESTRMEDWDDCMMQYYKLTTFSSAIKKYQDDTELLMKPIYDRDYNKCYEELANIEINATLPIYNDTLKCVAELPFNESEAEKPKWIIQDVAFDVAKNPSP